jgi:putative endonuclease
MVLGRGRRELNIFLGAAEKKSKAYFSNKVRKYIRKNTKTWKWYVYILELLNGRYYTGMTWNYIERYGQHLSGLGGKYTSRYGVKALVYVEEHEDFELAQKRELQIKDFSQKKKRLLIETYKHTLTGN